MIAVNCRPVPHLKCLSTRQSTHLSDATIGLSHQMVIFCLYCEIFDSLSYIPEDSTRSIEDREWYQEKQRQNDRKKFGSSYQNSYGWYYKLRGQEFGPCDKDNIMRLIREHTLSSDSLVKQGKQSQWIPIRNLPREFPADGRTIQQSAAHQQRKNKTSA